MSRCPLSKSVVVAATVLVAFSGFAVAADPPPPSGAHPRLFLNALTLPALAASAQTNGTASSRFIAACKAVIAKPADYATRGGVDGYNWPGSALNCAYAYAVTKDPQYLAPAIKYWIASLEDDQDLGDGKGCVASADPNWQSWTNDGKTPPPPVIITVSHDTGYPMRWYGPYISLAYDWLHDAPGVDEALRSHTRMCLQNWVDYYTQRGYHHDEAGANYNAGYVAGKTFAAIAMAGENGAASDRLWSETINEVFANLLVGKGLMGTPDTVGAPAGAMLGGDWGEGWQYGPLSVMEYALATRAMEESGVPLPEMDAWTNSLIVRYIHATVPHLDGQYAGGDFDSDMVFPAPSANVLDAVMAGPSSDRAASWASWMMGVQKVTRQASLGSALAEIRNPAPEDYTMQTPAPPNWYLARGTRALYVRSGWGPDAFWGVFTSSPMVNSDHHHFDASNFVFTRGGDHLIVDPSDYGCRSTLPTNAITADSAGVKGTYAPSQTPWTEAELPWARGTAPALFAARADIARAFGFADNPSDIKYAHREWAFLPEGEVVVIDRVRTDDAGRSMYVNLHTNTQGTLKMDGAVAVGTVGASQVVIHPVTLSGGAPGLTQPMVGSGCYDGSCSNVRFAVDEYSVKVPGPFAIAVHVVDGIGMGEDRATVGAINAPPTDPDHSNTAVIGAAVYRGSKQSYVVASSAQDGNAGGDLTYSVPGASAARHVVFDAPEDGDGRSMVTATLMGDRCSVTIVPGAGLTGHPLMFQVGSAADNCAVTEDTNVMPSAPPAGGGSEVTVTPTGVPVLTGGDDGNGGTGNGGGASGGGAPAGGKGLTSDASGFTGCGCAFDSPSAPPTLLGLGLVTAAALRRRRRSSR